MHSYLLSRCSRGVSGISGAKPIFCSGLAFDFMRLFGIFLVPSKRESNPVRCTSTYRFFIRISVILLTLVYFMSKILAKDVYPELKTMLSSWQPISGTGGVGGKPCYHLLGWRISLSARSCEPFCAKNLGMNKHCFGLFSSSIKVKEQTCDIWIKSRGHSEFSDALKLLSWIGHSLAPPYGKNELCTSLRSSRWHSRSIVSCEFRRSTWIFWSKRRLLWEIK